MKDYEMIIIYNQEVKKGKDKYNLIIEEKWINGWGIRFACGRRRPKFYSIKKNGQTILSTTLHQTWYAEKRKLLNEVK